MLDNNKVVHVEKPSLIGKLCDTINVFGGGRRSLPADAALIIGRFQQLLDGHKLNRAQLLKLVPADWKWSLGVLAEPHQLLAALTPDRLAWLANTFGVQSAWLEGRDVPIYRWPMGYKWPQRFLQTLEDLGWLRERDGFWQLRMTVFAANYRGDNGPLGDFVLVFSHPIAEWDDGETVSYRHALFEILMHWDHVRCRMDAKALARWFSMSHNSYGNIPIVRVDRATIVAVADGTAFPGPYLPEGFGGYDHLEDRVLSHGNPHGGGTSGESLVAIETDELPAVMAYMRERGIGSSRVLMPGTDVAEILRKFDEAAEPCDEHAVDSALLSLKPKDDDDWKPPADHLAERTAFSFDERITDDK